jgi:hypothetical protein
MSKAVTVVFCGVKEDEQSDILAFAHVKKKHFDAAGQLSDKKLVKLIEKLFALFDAGKYDYPFLEIVHLSSVVKPRTESWSFDARRELGEPTRVLTIVEAGTERKFFLQYDDNGMTQAPEL